MRCPRCFAHDPACDCTTMRWPPTERDTRLWLRIAEDMDWPPGPEILAAREFVLSRDYAEARKSMRRVAVEHGCGGERQAGGAHGTR